MYCNINIYKNTINIMHMYIHTYISMRNARYLCNTCTSNIILLPYNIVIS